MPRTKSIVRSDDLNPQSNNANAPPELNTVPYGREDIEVVPMTAMEMNVREAKFMEEKVLVEVEADNDDPNAPVFVLFGHNGVNQYVKRGEPQAIKRKFLYSALAAKTVKFACAFGKDNTGNDFNRLSANVRATHRVRLIEDHNPQGGMKWAQRVAAAG